MGKNALIGLKFSGYLTHTLNNILYFLRFFITIEAFDQQLTKQLSVAKSAAVVKEEKHKFKLSVDLRYKNNIFI